MVNILTDSTSDLGMEIIERRQIGVVPLYVTMGGQIYTDGVNITTQDLFHHVQAGGDLPKTAAPSLVDFQRAFDRAEESVYIGLSSRLSATVSTALVAREGCPPEKVHVVDSLNLSSGLGLLVLAAADLRDQGLPAAEIARQVSALVPKVRSAFMIETLEYMHKGGRCSAMQSLMSSLLHIRPVIAVRPDGTLGVRSKTRGARSKTLQVLLDDFAENAPNIDTRRVFITHTTSHSDADRLKDQIRSIAPVDEVIITDAGSVIASHCGPGTIGILYLLKTLP